MGTTIDTRRHTIREYLALERTACERHEYRDGQIVSIAGGTYKHSLIAANLIGECGNALKNMPCRVFDCNLRVGVPLAALYTYPDASIVCGKPEMDPNDDALETITNPRTLFEVISPSTEAYDRGDKFRRYRQIETLQEYVLISQDEPRVELFVRKEEGAWLFKAFTGLDGTLQLEGLAQEISLKEIYAGVEFKPEPPAQ